MRDPGDGAVRVEWRWLALVTMLIAAGVLASAQAWRPRTAARPYLTLSARVPAPSSASSTDDRIHFYQARLTDHPREAVSWDMLAVAYMRKLRESGDPAYAVRAEGSLGRARSVDPRDPEAPRLGAWVALVEHQFGDARTQAEALLRDTPDDDRLYGILGDADVELGRYDEARVAFQRLIDLKPGLSAYTRVAYLRELHGDVPGAEAMMDLAVEAASPRDRENLAWTRVQCGNLYFNHGHVHAAEEQYGEALRVFPGYLYGLAGMANVRAAEGRLEESARLDEQSLAVIPLPVVASTLGDVYLRLGRVDDAERQFALVEYIGQLTDLNRIVFNRDLAFFYADHHRHVDRAVALAEREASSRHDIYTLDTLAWAYAAAGRVADADRLIGQALSLGTRDALLYYHAGVIASKRGDRPRAIRYLALALHTNPHFHVLHAEEARRLLAALRSASGEMK